MKNSKIYLLIVLLAIALITGGIIISITPSTNTNKKEQQPTETRKYKTVETVPADTVNPLSKEEGGFASVAKKSGFETVLCNENTCTASNKGYTNSKSEDTVVYSYDKDGKVDNFNVAIYMYKSDYNVDTVTARLNSVIKNYVGTDVSKEFIQNIMSNLEKSNDGIYIDTMTVGTNTAEINIGKANEEYYIIKYWLISTETYNQYKGIK